MTYKIKFRMSNAETGGTEDGPGSADSVDFRAGDRVAGRFMVGSREQWFAGTVLSTERRSSQNIVKVRHDDEEHVDWTDPTSTYLRKLCGGE